jgi:hypothetical protein
MQIVVMPSVIIQIVIMPSVIIQSVIMQSVVAPSRRIGIKLLPTQQPKNPKKQFLPNFLKLFSLF